MGSTQRIGTRFLSSSMVIKYGVAALMCLLELRPYVNTVRGGKFPRSPFYAAIGTK